MTIYKFTHALGDDGIACGMFRPSVVNNGDGTYTTTFTKVPPIEPPKFDMSSVTFNGVCMFVCWILGIIGLSQSSLLTIVFGGIFTGIAVMFAMRGAAALSRKLVDERGEAVAKAAADAQAETFMAGPPR